MGNFSERQWGISASAISAHGADFRPYRALLGDQGIGTPHVIVTDGDTDPDKRGRTNAGIKRGARLLPQTQRDELLERIKKLPEVGDAGYGTALRPIVNELEQAGIFVGWQTLEADLCTLLGDEIKAAFAELSRSKPARDDVNAGVDDQSDCPIDVAIRDTMLSRITALGKGRFAQRLAAHIAKVDLRARVAEVIAGDPSADLTIDAYNDLRVGYIFKALNAISEQVRGEPLLPQCLTVPEP